MSKYVLDGQVYVQRKTGIYRYCNEILKELDKIIEPNEIELVVPKEAIFDHDFSNIKVVRYGRGNGVLWAQTYLPLYCRKNKVIPISFYNTTPIFRPGVVVIHDVAYKAFSKSYNSIYGKMSSLWHRFNYWYISKQKYQIITVSQFSKGEICKYYHVDPKRIVVIGNGWQHYLRIGEDTKVFQRIKLANPKEYYFAMGSIENRKNFKWIIEISKKNPKDIFIITGKNSKNANVTFENADNIVFTGFLSDPEVKTLMQNAKAFLFPSIYEGFGIPPLEAMSMKTPVICSSISCLKEICGNAVCYIDPFDYSVVLDELDLVYDNNLINEVLEKYSWKDSALVFREIIRKGNK